MRSPKVMLLSLLVFINMGTSTVTPEWPMVRPVHEKRVFVDPEGKTDTPLTVFLHDTRGVPVYKLECHNGNYGVESGIWYSGDFQCALFALKGASLASGDLLAANTKDELSSDWWNRGRMRAAQLRGACLAYPEYSTDRHFKLRGMLLTLHFADMKWDPRKDKQNEPRLAKFTFLLRVVPDESVQSSRAELPPGPKPPSACYP